MKKVIHILLIISLSLPIVMIGKGMNLVICEHSHTIQFFPSNTKKIKNISNDSSRHCPPVKEHCNDEEKDCMDEIFFSISQPEITQQLNIEYYPIILSRLFPNNGLGTVDATHRDETYLNLHPKPPRDYLSRLSTLII